MAEAGSVTIGVSSTVAAALLAPVILAAFGGPVSAQPAPPAISPPLAHTIVSAGPFLALPTLAQMQQAYPIHALRLHMEGHARMRCIVAADTTLQNCEILSESPPDEGFGAAALALATYFRVRPMQIDGVAVGGGALTIPIAFKPA